MDGFHSLAVDFVMAAGFENALPFCVAAKMDARPLRQPCHATQTRPVESVAAAGSISVPTSDEMRTTVPGLPFSAGRPQMSKFPLSFDAQKTHGLPLPSTATAGR